MSLSIAHVTIDCDNAAELADFWSRLLDHPVDVGSSEYFATVGRSESATLHPVLMFIKVPEPKESKNRVHLDLHAEDLQGQVDRAIALGAKRVADFDEYGTRWTTLTDPEGNEFDIGAGMEATG